MRSLHTIAFSAVMAVSAMVATNVAVAQEAEPQAPIASSAFGAFERGDGILSLSLGTSVPLGFYNPNSSAFEGPNSGAGFSFSLSYTGFLSERWGLAGDLSGDFIRTVNDDQLFIAPIALRAVMAFPVGAFAIAPSAGLGVAISSLGSYKHVDPLFKAGGTFLWKASSDMSYGLNLYANVIPQIMTEYPENTRVGFFLDATLSVAYHL